MSGRAAPGIALACALVGAAGCPRLPPPPPRPSVALVGLERVGPLALRARLLVDNRGAASLVLSAIDWEIALGEQALVRGRAHVHRRFAPDQRAAIDIAIPLPAPLADEVGAAGGEWRLRGTAHLEPGAPAPFDEPATFR